MQVFHCSHCGIKGTTDPEKSGKKKEYVLPPEYPVNLPEPLVQYMKGRGFTEGTMRLFGLTATTQYFPQIGREAGSLSIPYKTPDGVIRNWKHRDANKNFIMEKDALKLLFNLNMINDSTDYLYIFEGEFDCMAAVQCGITQSVSVPNGATLQNNNLDYIGSSYEYISFKKKFIICTDDDTAGKKLREEIADRMGRQNCTYVSFGDFKDANKFLQENGLDELKRKLQKEQEKFPIFGVVDIYSQKEEILKYNFSDHINYSTGFKGCDDKWKVSFPEWTVVTGSPGSGKSEVVEQIIVNLNRKLSAPCAMFVPESTPIEQHFDRILQKMLCQSNLTENQKEMYFDYMAENFYWIDEDIEGIDMKKTLSIFAQLATEKGIKIFYIDPFNYLKDLYGGIDAIGHALTLLTKFVKNYNAHVFLVAHPKKPTRNKDGMYADFTLYDIANSADFYNKTFNGLVIKRLYDQQSPSGTDLINVSVEKVKKRANGRAGGSFLVYPDFNNGGEIMDFNGNDSPPNDLPEGNFTPLLDD